MTPNAAVPSLTGPKGAHRHEHPEGSNHVQVRDNDISCGVQVTDMRTQKELATYRGHNRDVTCAAWHPQHEELFASGGYDGSLMYWLVSNPNPQVGLSTAPPPLPTAYGQIPVTRELDTISAVLICCC